MDRVVIYSSQDIDHQHTVKNNYLVKNDTLNLPLSRIYVIKMQHNITPC